MQMRSQPAPFKEYQHQLIHSVQPIHDSQLLKDLLRASVMQLQAAHIESASLDARLLLQHVLGVSREKLFLEPEMTCSASQAEQYRALIEERALRRPIAQLIGKREFWGMEFKVTSDTLDPRPDSETLIEAVLASSEVKDKAGLHILDLGTGTGCLLLSLLKECKLAKGTGVDRSIEALSIAKSNAVSLGLEDRCEFIHSDWFSGISGMFDIIISNPPYIPTRDIALLEPEVAQFEPVSALDGGVDGMDAYRAILAQASLHMTPGGLAVFEIGIGQEAAFLELAKENGFALHSIKRDLAAIPRAIIIQLS